MTAPVDEARVRRVAREHAQDLLDSYDQDRVALTVDEVAPFFARAIASLPPAKGPDHSALIKELERLINEGVAGEYVTYRLRDAVRALRGEA